MFFVKDREIQEDTILNWKGNGTGGKSGVPCDTTMSRCKLGNDYKTLNRPFSHDKRRKKGDTFYRKGDNSNGRRKSPEQLGLLYTATVQDVFGVEGGDVCVHPRAVFTSGNI